MNVSTIEVGLSSLFDFIIIAAKKGDFENVIYFAETAKKQIEKYNENSVAKTEPNSAMAKLLYVMYSGVYDNLTCKEVRDLFPEFEQLRQ